MSYELPPEWAFRSTITTPEGVQADVTITVPFTEAWTDVVETSELAQRAAVHAINDVKRTREQALASTDLPF